MKKFQRKDLYSLEQYAELRNKFRQEVMQHKHNRRLELGPNAVLYFEDRLTMQYQIHEMLRIERIFEPAGIAEELATYNPLIPDGCNWKATFMIEYPDASERDAMLRQLVGIESHVWLQVGDWDVIRPIADEDLERSNEEKTSAVHFLRFELPAEQIVALKGGESLAAGIDHENYQAKVRPVADNIRNSLIQDLD